MITLTISPHPTIPWAALAKPGDYREQCHAQFAEMPGPKWDKKAGHYVGDAVAIECVARILERAGVVKVKRHVVRNLREPSPPQLKPVPGLFDYQIDGARWILQQLEISGAALLADEMGVGKTPQVIAACCAHPRIQSILVICPAIVVTHWERLIRTWGDSQRHWQVYSFEGLKRFFWGDKAQPHELDLYDTVVIDEGHYCSNGREVRKGGKIIRGSQRSHCVRLARTQARYAIMTTGTPINAYVADAWNLLDILWPGRFGSFWGFTRRYADGHNEEIKLANDESKSVYRFGGHSNLEELNERLAVCMLRRTKQDVQLELPPITRTCIEVDLPRKAANALARANRAQQWSDHALARMSINSALSAIEDYKLDAAEQLAKELLAAGSNPLILTTRKASAEELAHRLGCAFVHGSNSTARNRRDKIANERIACATIHSVTTGIDLVGFDVVIFVGLDWVPATLQQAIMRLYRIGQQRPVTVYFMVGRGTLDEVVRERVIERLEIFSKAIGGGDGDGMRDALVGGSEEELIEQLIKGVMAA